MDEFIALNNLLLAIVATFPIIVFSAALLTFLAYWFFIGRHSHGTPENDAESMRIMQDIRIGLKLRNRRSDIEREVTTTTNEESGTWQA